MMWAMAIGRKTAFSLELQFGNKTLPRWWGFCFAIIICMANHKRHRTKSQRSGCLLCKPHKVQGNSMHAQKPKYRPITDYPDVA